MALARARHQVGALGKRQPKDLRRRVNDLRHAAAQVQVFSQDLGDHAEWRRRLWAWEAFHASGKYGDTHGDDGARSHD